MHKTDIVNAGSIDVEVHRALFKHGEGDVFVGIYGNIHGVGEIAVGGKRHVVGIAVACAVAVHGVGEFVSTLNGAEWWCEGCIAYLGAEAGFQITL